MTSLAVSRLILVGRSRDRSELLQLQAERSPGRSRRSRGRSERSHDGDPRVHVPAISVFTSRRSERSRNARSHGELIERIGVGQQSDLRLGLVHPPHRSPRRLATAPTRSTSRLIRNDSGCADGANVLGPRFCDVGFRAAFRARAVSSTIPANAHYSRRDG